MSIPLKAGAVTVTHANSNENDQIFKAAKVIWGIEPDKLPPEKFNELKTVLVDHLTKRYGPYEVEGKPLDSGHVFIICMEPEVLEPSYERSPCSLGTCMVTNAAFKCARCLQATYCSREHQEKDWRRHKVECSSKK